MKKLLLPAVILLFIGCRLPVRSHERHNFIFTTIDIVGDQAYDYPSYTEVFIDNKKAGKTEELPLSQRSSLRMTIPPGNRLVKAVKYIQDPEDDQFKALLKKHQPQDRFVEVSRTKVTFFEIIYSENSRRYKINTGIMKK